MIATILLSVLIFGAAGWVVYRQLTGKKGCEDCQSACPVKHEQQANE